MNEPLILRITLLLTAVLVAATAAVVVLRPAAPATLDDRARSVAETLRCPACRAESVADSANPTAQGMRAVIRTRLAEGESPEELRTYFVERYGDSVLLEPPRTGPSALLWVAPVGALAVGVVIALRLLAVRRPQRPSHRSHPQRRSATPVRPMPAGSWRRLRTASAAVVSAVALTLVAVALNDAVTARVPGSPATGGSVSDTTGRGDVVVGRELEAAGDLQGAAQAYQVALEHHPENPDIAFRLAFVLVQLGRPVEAEPVLAGVLRTRPDHPDTLLLLGIVQRQLGRKDSTETLRRYLDVAPKQHPAVHQVRELVAEPP